VSIYCVLDGHGGEWCAVFLRQKFEAAMRKNLLDPKYGLYGTERKGLSQVADFAFKQSFKILDEHYHREL